MSLTKVACISDVDASDSWRASYKVVYLALCSSEWMCSVCYEGDRGVMDCVNCIILFDETKVYKIRNIIPTETLFRPIGYFTSVGNHIWAIISLMLHLLRTLFKRIRPL